MLRVESVPVRAFLLLCGVALVCIFLIPVAFGIVNSGNVAGALAGVCLVLFAACNRPFSAWLDRLWSKGAGKVLIVSAGGILVCGGLLCLVFSAFMLRAAHKKPPETPKAVIVLGCKVRGETPSRMLSRRIDAAYDALSRYEDMIAVVSGGKGTDEEISEAACMARELQKRGISPERIFLEERSATTAQNLKFSKEVLTERGISLDEPVLIATDGYHECRAQLFARREGFTEVAAASARTSWYLLPTYVVREWFGLAHALVLGS